MDAIEYLCSYQWWNNFSNSCNTKLKLIIIIIINNRVKILQFKCFAPSEKQAYMTNRYFYVPQLRHILMESLFFDLLQCYFCCRFICLDKFRKMYVVSALIPSAQQHSHVIFTSLQSTAFSFLFNNSVFSY